VVVDDPHSVDQAESDVKRQAAVEWFSGTMGTRLNDLATGHKVVIQQRLHENDVTGDLLAKGGYEHLCLPAEFEPERRCVTSIWSDPRTEAGQLLWPEKVSVEDLAKLKRLMGSYRYAGQYQQRPAPADGGIFKSSWFRFWRRSEVDLAAVPVRLADGSFQQIQAVPLPEEFDTIIQSWDMAFKDNADSDFVVGQVWGTKGADRFLLYQQRARLDMPGTKEAVRSLSARYPKATAKLVEDKANGPAVIQELRHEIEGLIEVSPEGGKISRAHSVAPMLEAGNVYLPHPASAPWVEEFLEEAIAFPQGRHDDQVDAMTQALNRLRQSGGRFKVLESEIVIDPFPIPEEWPQAFGLAIEPNGVAAVWGARDPNGTLYLYAEHELPHNEVSENARAIKQCGAWIPGMLTTTSVQGSEAMRDSLADLYRKEGLMICTPYDAQAPYEIQTLLANRKIKVFASLGSFRKAYRIGESEALLFKSWEALIAGRPFMKSKPKPRARRLVLEMPSPNAWMAR
jgi:predicted phage terminase large subunit-like protein